MDMDIEICFSIYIVVVSDKFIFLLDTVFMRLQDLSKYYTIYDNNVMATIKKQNKEKYSIRLN
jgi:hypothetical protein